MENNKLLKYSQFIDSIKESVVKRSKDFEVFKYNNIKNALWKSIIKEAKDFQNINFDLENDDSVESRTIFINQLLRKDQKVKTEVNLELRIAGGDWEIPVYYFRIEFTHDHFISSNKANPPEYVWDLTSNKRNIDNSINKYCFIPSIEDGNSLKKMDNGLVAYTDEDDVKLKSDKETIKEIWKNMEDLIHKLADDRHKLLESMAGKNHMI